MIPVASPAPLSGLKTSMVVVTARLTGGGTGAAPTNADASLMGGGEVVSTSRISAGVFDLVLRRSFPELKAVAKPAAIGTTAGLNVDWVAFDIVNRTARIRVLVGTAPTDPALTDSIHLTWIARDSGKNA